MDVDDLFNQYLPQVKSKDSIDPLANIFSKSNRKQTSEKEPEYYDVDDTPLPQDDGILRLKMPILRNPDADALMASRVAEPPLCPGVSVHMGYQPITEEEAFKNPVSIHSLSACHFTIPRGQMSVDQIIDRIRKVVFSTEDIHEIAPKNVHFKLATEKCRRLYESTILFTTFDQYSNHRFARIYITIAASDNDEFAIAVYHIQGDTRLSMEFFLTIRSYVLSEGKSECKVRNPELFNGFADQYIDEMSEPPTLAIFAEVDEE